MKPTNYHPSSTFDSLYVQYERLVRAIVSRVLHRFPSSVDDACQTIWIETFEAVQAGTTPGKTWLELRARSRALDVRQHLNCVPETSLDGMIESDQGRDDDDGHNSLLDRLQYDQQSTDDTTLDLGVREYIREAVATLSEPLRLVLMEHYYAAKSLTEIAFQHNLKIGTVKWRLSAAREALKARLLPTDPASSQEVA